MDWDASGEFMVTSSLDRTVYLYSVNKAGLTNVLQSKKHGVSAVRFTHEGPRQIVCSSSRDTPTASVKLWDTVENRYIKSFSLASPVRRGRAISPHPSRDLMLISTWDTCLLYTYDNSSPLVSASYNGASMIGAFDSLGLIFAICDSTHSRKSLSLYDMSKYQAPFATFDLGKILLKSEEVVSVDFNPNGRSLVLGTNYTRLLCVNAVTGSAAFACCYSDEPAIIKEQKVFCYPSISSDGKYLLCGCTNGSISIWNFKGQSVCSLVGHEGPPYFACFNPRKAMISSACVKVAWWQPALVNSDETL
ncbi:hypothetical protein, conserved [Babesia bigemina]|uniref:Uncharacterized protein n=1 Tax=Babesia bigemina TaxID=5866 RepID=A0A061D927_BABBI|nr:hypothetical protein, conserved [Babesia bigemina]CDR94230.1 hypothetical protein, conserved [Babesia bigemina]|eukprot:XP_012766416.1 hypothetical protein, conserved [Babesia bigemina]